MDVEHSHTSFEPPSKTFNSPLVPPGGATVLSYGATKLQGSIQPSEIQKADDEATENEDSSSATDKTPEESSSKSCLNFKNFITNFKLNSFVVVSVLVIAIPLITWLIAYLLVGSQDLPGGSVFVLIVLEFGGRILGYSVMFIKLPPMVGMLGLGIAIRNIPYLDFGKYMNPDISTPIRQIALAIILIRAGLGLDLHVLMRLKTLVCRLALFPTIFEAATVGLLAHFLIGFPWSWSFLVGFVIAAVSPAVVVPRLLHLKEEGYGVKKGVPTIVLASASLDNVAAICFFGVTMGFVFSNKSITERILQGPIEILLGLGVGLIWGAFCGFIFQNSEEKIQRNETLQRTALILGGGIISVIGCSHLGYSGAGALGCLLMAFVASCLWRSRGIWTHDDSMPWIFTFLWLIFEPLLFGVIGCQIELTTLDKRTVLLGLACLSIGALVRFATTYTMVCGTELNIKEKIFVAICWSPKATVQAAIGPMALDMARSHNNSEEIDLGQQVLTLAVLAILLTAPLGEMGVILSGPKLLQKDRQDDQEV